MSAFLYTSTLYSMRLSMFSKGPGPSYSTTRDRPLAKGSVIYVPKGAWHGFDNASNEMLLLWVVAPPGLDAFFREVASTPGEPPKPPLSREQLNDIANKYGTSFRL